MSTIVLFPDDSIWLICKGAESTIIPNCIGGPINQTLEHINDYALLGLRTLAISARQLTSEQYGGMMEKLNEARQMMVDRELYVSQIFDVIESDMTLLGATGVEDQLQDGVAETLEALRAAGIKVWVLTGDKLETAINIAYSCGHFKRGMQLLTLTAQTSPAECQETLWRLRRRIWDEPIQNFGFVVDGESLAHSLREHRQLLSEVCSHCNTVVCCRMSPIQKAEVVKVVKGFSSKPITAAIGDGANDVSMIQEANVGIGIMGKEGRQAVRCSDFAFARFRFLRRVLLVHGHWYYWRLSTLVQYFFYKNITFITPAVFFAIFSAYSTQPIYDTFFLTFYNIFFYIVAYFDFWSPRAKLYLSSVARKSPSLQGHCQQRSYELVLVFQVETFRYLKSNLWCDSSFNLVYLRHSRSLAFRGHLFRLYTSLGIGFARSHYGLLEFWNANLYWCHCRCELEVDDSISSLDCPLCDLDPALRFRIYGSRLFILWDLSLRAE
ncbi:phospholipid-transporting ATPase IF-like [Daphnia pulicaria]|uniref:phospholipid-transporting ATPase IF-like n=1 Tax=Daphnia pulicaria TaxID=35523 RepID=UPI001EE9D1C1|nr:phospholipid-transporting ATPase IF-like [Daphnia pulicaria]